MTEGILYNGEGRFTYIAAQSFLSSKVLILIHANGISEESLVKIHHARFREGVKEELPNTDQNMQEFIGSHYLVEGVGEIGHRGRKFVRNSEGFYQHSDELLDCVRACADKYCLNAIDYTGIGSLEDALEIHLQNMIEMAKMPESIEFHIEGLGNQ